MSSILLIARRDLRAYLDSTWGWVIVAAILFIDGLLFNGGTTWEACKRNESKLCKSQQTGRHDESVQDSIRRIP